MNLGKRFENNFRDSVPDDVFFYRFRDSALNFTGVNSMNMRFTPSNIADNLLFYNGSLYLNELKHHFGKSLPFSCISSSKTKESQIKDLINASKYPNVYCNLIIYLSDVNKCFALDINTYYSYYSTTDKKSIPLSFLEDNAIELPVIPKKTNIKLDLSPLFKR